MLSEINFPLSGEYRTGGDWQPVVFHMDALMEGKQLDLILGYFSSSAISTFVCGFAKFISNGRLVRMVVNHVFSEKDKDSILKWQATGYISKNY